MENSKVRKGTISLGIGEGLYEAVWTLDPNARTVSYDFLKKLPSGKQYDRRNYEELTPFTPYTLGTLIVNEEMQILAQQKAKKKAS